MTTVEPRVLFEAVYQQDVWGHADGSGHGSTVEYTTGLRRVLKDVIGALGIASLIDAGCGAGVWQHALLTVDGVAMRYHGVDASATAVSRASGRLAPLGATVAVGDVCRDPLPRGFDAVLSRDCLQHMSLEGVAAAMENLAACGARWYLIGGYYPGKNARVSAAYHFDVNLTQAPFGLSPDFVHSEGNPPNEPHKHVFVFSGERLRATDWSAMRARVAAFV